MEAIYGVTEQWTNIATGTVCEYYPDPDGNRSFVIKAQSGIPVNLETGTIPAIAPETVVTILGDASFNPFGL